MSGIKTVSDVVGRWFAVIVLAAGALALAAPGLFAGGTAAVPWLLTLIMLGMGLTLRPADFGVVARRPRALLLGVAAQYVVMPLVGLGLARALDLSPALAAGMVLVGAAPGGTASNVMVYLSRGDTALSVAMTSVSTLLAPVLTPLLVLWLAGEFLPVDAGGCSPRSCGSCWCRCCSASRFGPCCPPWSNASWTPSRWCPSRPSPPS